MATVDSLPFLRRITGFVQSRVEGVPGFIATLISPHVAVAPRAALPDPDPADGAYRFAMLVRSEVVSFPLTLAAADDLIVAFRVDEPSPFHVEIPPSTLNPSEPRSTEATTVLQDASAGVLRPVPASVSVVDTREGLRLQVHIASEGELQRVLGAPIAAGDAVIGIVGRIDRDSPLAIPSSLIRESVAVQATLRSAPPSTGEFSRTAWLAVERADAMRRQQNLSEVHMDHLLAGLVVVGGEVADRLLSQLGTDREGALQLVESTADLSLPREYAVAPLKMLPALSKHAGEAIQAAAILARDRGSARIERSDLLLGALSITRCSTIETLLSRGADPKKLSAGVRRLVGESIGGARYVADTVGERDHDQLDIMREVNALATVLAARSTPLPLSIGLFGDWGSGKSFFMKKLEQQIDECSRKACEELKGLVVQARHQREKKNSMAAAQRGNGSGAAPADGDGRSTSGAEEEPLSIKLEDLKSPFCTHVVQLTFNAWHYVDTNLWASLAAAIFDGLATKLESVEALGAEEERQKLKKDLLEHTAHLRHEEERLLGRKRQLDQELRDEEAHLAHLRSEEIRLQKRISSRDVLKSAAREVLRDDKVRTAIGEIAEAAGISEKGAADSHLGERLLEMSAWRRVAWSFWKVVRRGGWMYAVLMTTSLVLLVLGLTLAGAWWPSGSAWIAGLGLGRVWSAVLAVAAAMGAAVPVLRRLSPVLEHLAVLRRKRSLELEKQRQNHLRTLDRLRDDREGVQQQISSVTREIGNLVGQLARLSPEGELAEQVRERAASSDYRRHLGVIASARADFDQLSRRLANVLDQRTLEVRGEDFPARIDRIVLYIDDLDRCPEDKVVDVLQAVHLLLAFPLFVVVVGVDSRWLLHSLRRHSAHLRGPGDANAAAADEGEEGGWRSTPQNYLEKIFQVPYTLRAMDTDGFRSLINALARPAAEEEPMESAAIETEGGPGSSSGSGGAPDAASQPGTSSRSGAGPTSPRGDTGSAGDPANGAAHDPAARSSALDAEKLELSDWEIAFMEEMHPFIGTPRAAKRFVNVYRLLRASTDRQQLQHLAGTREDGDYRAVLLLLALLTGYPAEATALLLDLADWKADQTWWEYLDRLRDATAGAEAEARFGRVEGFEAARWFRMLDQCSSLRVVVPDSLPVDAFRRWAWEVARFSFYSGRALLDRDGNGVSPAVHYATPLPAAALPPAAPASAA